MVFRVRLRTTLMWEFTRIAANGPTLLLLIFQWYCASICWLWLCWHWAKLYTISSKINQQDVLPSSRKEVANGLKILPRLPVSRLKLLRWKFRIDNRHHVTKGDKGRGNCENVTYKRLLDQRGHMGTAEEDIRLRVLFLSSAGYNNRLSYQMKKLNLHLTVTNKQEHPNRPWKLRLYTEQDIRHTSRRTQRRIEISMNFDLQVWVWVAHLKEHTWKLGEYILTAKHMTGGPKTAQACQNKWAYVFDILFWDQFSQLFC